MKKEVKLNELEQFVKEFLNNLLNSSFVEKEAFQNVFGLCGNLGSGKTTFVKEAARQFGVKEEVTSPTFTLVKNYEIKDLKFRNQNFKKLVHIDLYRIENSKELETLKLEEIFADKSSLVLIEWADRLFNQESGFRNQELARIEFDYCDEESRIIKIQND